MNIGPRWEMEVEDDGETYYIIWLQEDGEELTEADLIDWDNPTMLIKSC